MFNSNFNAGFIIFHIKISSITYMYSLSSNEGMFSLDFNAGFIVYSTS